MPSYTALKIQQPPWHIANVNTVTVVNNGYFSSSGGTINLTLPANFAVGDVIRISNIAGQFSALLAPATTVNFGNTVVNTSITSTNVGDTIELIGCVANTTWQLVSTIGNLTLV